MHEVLGLQVRPAKRAEPVARTELTLVAGEGIDGDHGRGGRRHVTILFSGDWEAALADLGRDVPPGARRANVLVSGAGAAAWIGRRIRLGEAVVEVRGEVRPCERMDEAADGLRAALEPSGRGGVWGVVVEGGTVRTGDRLAGEG